MGRMLFFTLISMMIAGEVLSQESSWKPLSSGTNGTVNALTIYDGKLIAAGRFSTAGGVQANCIAAWDGRRWSALGPGIDITGGEATAVYALTTYRNQLIAAGSFPRAGGKDVSRIASWDGKKWSRLGTGLSSRVIRAVAVYKGRLIVAGDLCLVGVPGAYGVAAWDGNTWSAIGAFGDNSVEARRFRALSVYDNELVVGGEIPRLRAWNGSSWRLFGEHKVPNGILSLAIHDGVLVIGGTHGGSFGGYSGPTIGSWDGNSWSRIGSNIEGAIWALAEIDGNLVAAGWFCTNLCPYSGVMEWNGRSWAPIQMKGFKRGTVFALAEYEQQLIAAGRWQWSEWGDSIPKTYIAAWSR